jgi:hypothetical protein
MFNVRHSKSNLTLEYQIQIVASLYFQIEIKRSIDKESAFDSFKLTLNFMNSN